MKLKITILAFLAIAFGFHKMQANAPLSINGEAATVMMTTEDNSLIVSAGCHIYAVNMQTYQATLLTSSPYVSEINSLAVDANTGWIFYVSNEASTYNWTVLGYNVYSNTHKSFGDIRSYFTGTGHAYSSRGLGSGGATFYNGKLYFAMEYPTTCNNYRTSSGVVNVKDELKRDLEGSKLNNGSLINTSNETDIRRTGSREILPITRNNTRIRVTDSDNYNVRDYMSESSLIDNSSSLSGSNSGNTLRSSYYNNRIYLLEVCFNNLSDFSGDSSNISNASPKYDSYGYSSFLYKGELGDIAVSDEGEIYAVTSYQIQHFDFNTNTFCWANNEDVYAQIAKDKNSNFHLLKNQYTCSHDGYCNSTCTRKSFVQSYTQPGQLQTYNNIQLGSLIEIHGLSSEDQGRITDAADYLNLNIDVEVSYSIEGTVFDDDNENGTQEIEEANFDNVTVTLYADSNNDGTLDTGDVQLGVTTSNIDGNYNFTNITEEDVLVIVTVPANTTDGTYTLTTNEVVVITSTEDISGVDFGINEELVLRFDITGVVWDDDNKDGVQDSTETPLPNIIVNLYNDLNEDGILDSGDEFVATRLTSSMNPNYSFNNVTAGNIIIQAITPPDNPPFILFYTTFDLDSGIINPDGLYAFDLQESVDGVDFGIDKELGNSRRLGDGKIKTDEPVAIDETMVERELDENSVAESLELFNGIKLYPNPSSKFIIVKSDMLDSNTVVNIYSITGKLIMTKDYSTVSNLSEVKIDLEQLSAGLYLAKITTSSNETIVKRFVKQ